MITPSNYDNYSTGNQSFTNCPLREVSWYIFSAKSCTYNWILKKGNIEQKGISLARFTGRCLASQQYKHKDIEKCNNFWYP